MRLSFKSHGNIPDPLRLISDGVFLTFLLVRRQGSQTCERAH